MAGFGRAPKPEGQRRHRNPGLKSSTTQLPASGRTGQTPDWPLSRPVKRELDLWRRLWVTPQAVAWESLGWTDVVARYARLVCAANERDAQVTLLGEVRQLEDRLGLSPMAMLRLRWEIVDNSADLADDGHQENVLNARQRFAAVDN